MYIVCEEYKRSDIINSVFLSIKLSSYLLSLHQGGRWIVHMDHFDE